MPIGRREQKAAIKELRAGARFTRPMCRQEAAELIEHLGAVGPETGQFAFIGDGPNLEQATNLLLALHRRRDGRYDVYRAFHPEDHQDGPPPDHLTYAGLSLAEAAVIVGGRIGLHVAGREAEGEPKCP